MAKLLSHTAKSRRSTSRFFGRKNVLIKNECQQRGAVKPRATLTMSSSAPHLGAPVLILVHNHVNLKNALIPKQLRCSRLRPGKRVVSGPCIPAKGHNTSWSSLLNPISCDKLPRIDGRR
jgi:hypothetical protein